ncbi:MAG: sugar phosphate isomerase/epimerase, partial [Ruminiclostridium sp.]|nr:sugar phosphate isomerase/epimerase [Ruminiclostridium sp.]
IHSDKNIAHNIALYPSLQEISERYALRLTIENVVCNHADPLLHWKALADRYPEIEFTFDTKMAAFHGQLDEFYKEENKRLTTRIRHMHVNDYSGGYMEWSRLKTLHIGDGHIDFESFFRWVREIGYGGDFTVEATSFDQSGKIDFEKMNETIRRLRAYL